ncbi:MAG: hypothetical protein FJ126_04930 [Deltaproteobacteria bacterium]|nr:hypothetical protein [Deltaproteobacteria bacterium]
MWDFLVNIMSHAGAQVVFLVLFAWYFFHHRKDASMPASRIGWIRFAALASVFAYLMLSWSSGIRPALAQAAVFGMFLINLYLLNLVICSRLERPYRRAIETYCLEPQNQEHLNGIWGTGKRFYYFGFFLQSLLSGGSPARFLHEIAAGRIRDDIHHALARCGEAGQFISLNGVLSYLESQLGRDETLPQDFKDLIHKEIQQFGKHAWIEAQVNDYLRTAIENPENIHNPQWSQMWDKARGKP